MTHCSSTGRGRTVAIAALAALLLAGAPAANAQDLTPNRPPP